MVGDAKMRGFNSNRSNHPAYSRWKSMNERCYSVACADYSDYGARGIVVCAEWRFNADAFLLWCDENGFKIELELDRRNNDGNYCPDNCRFVSNGINQQNKRMQSNNKSGYRGVCWNKNKQKWQAQINIFGKQKSCGAFTNKIEAAKARDRCAIKFGIDTILNFPVEKENNND